VRNLIRSADRGLRATPADPRDETAYRAGEQRSTVDAR
jgi:hypothetical protein